MIHISVLIVLSEWVALLGTLSTKLARYLLSLQTLRVLFSLATNSIKKPKPVIDWFSYKALAVESKPGSLFIWTTNIPFCTILSIHHKRNSEGIIKTVCRLQNESLANVQDVTRPTNWRLGHSSSIKICYHDWAYTVCLIEFLNTVYILQRLTFGLKWWKINIT